ncbi:Protein SERAC1 [Daldinia childiae]|uniref:Protein SERAC1 n=1 Tax=Daldinia childiae TaxID=326645 RepID=UPI00144633E1|nr:Protein SERAC1 [Daldinia childiae]KAF3067404.1 Protein SERAC1 [Daldinia childiae]
MNVLLIPDSQQGSINKQISRYETTAVYTHPDAKVDIVLVHGLNGDPHKTWTAKNDVFWPTDLLPTSLRDARANILVYGYNADVYSKKHGANPSDNFIYMHAQTLVTSLTHYRKDEQTSHNPIIWVCHSLGGILVKRALLYSNDLRSSQHEDYRSIYVATYGLIFLGTPHTGSDLATWGTMLQAMSDAVVPRTFFQSESVLLRTLKRDNETLQNINIHFLDIYQRFKILMAHENHKSDLKGTRMLIVDAHSASPQLPGVTYFSIEATHSGMCKFDSRNAPGYRTIATALRDWVADAPDVIATRWRVEEDEKLARAKHEIEERMKPWLDSQRFQQAGQGSNGIHFDLVGLQDYIPFTRNTGIIYTSTERTTGEEYQFDNPQVIALDALTKQEAQELLFEEMGKRQPYTQDDLRRAEELVELMDRLPLMIHVAALQLKATREPLAKYLRSFRSRPKVGNLLAYRAVREQLEHRGATAALNLMSLLSFFGTHIPVEMIVLGAKALDKRTPVKTADPETRRSSLNNTFKILIAFALVERNENTEASSASSHSTRSVDMGQDSLDILRVHGIVQAFFIDALAEEKQAPFWLERAICIFCKAFDASDRRATDDPQTGVPEDFRRLRIHGERLLAHISRFEKRHPDLTQCREFVESRLSTIDTRIDELTKRITDASSQGSEPIVVSVFERTNSLSEEDSLTPPSNNSIVEPYILYDENSPLSPLESPAIYSATDYNPYHWHVTYPHGVPYDDVDHSRTVTPQPAPTEVFESMSMPDDDEVTRKVFGPHHRTIKRHAERRYRDHAGSWRAASQILSDPRVSISRETAKGIINATAIQPTSRPRSSTDSISSDATKAQLTLDRINRGSPSSQQRSAEDNIESVSDIFSVARPRLIAGKPSYADAKAEAAVDDDYPVSVTFSSPAPSPNNAATSILKRRENDRSVSLDGLAPVKISSDSRAETIFATALKTSLDVTFTFSLTASFKATLGGFIKVYTIQSIPSYRPLCPATNSNRSQLQQQPTLATCS